ncbi:hypothetical protein [Testudinibacter aquarius]|uniref:Uncharacterized protein n=1 Tax=Testudinibacter aquarius TaxID=1524974 RepID=A0A4R3Y266_9PAST|nr:hypothetical protein [Testudinibacter aquarius]KAE9525991.1 hypothetical protein A1D24_12590 [Testudinibacter aquarius]TCV85780.1 hypothetical protein EDC16_10887 [Testudinibacter aquarius]
MNLVKSEIIKKIFDGELDIAIFTINSNQYFIFDDKENYTVDIKPFYNDYLNRNIISLEQYKYAIVNYRGGVHELTKENVFNYFDTLFIPPRDSKWMSSFFMDGYDIDELISIYKYIEKYLLSSSEKQIDLLDWKILEARLPRFYLNLDRRIFMHTCWDRSFEKDIPNNWSGEASSRFWSLIPDKDSYWLVNNMNFWKLYG